MSWPPDPADWQRRRVTRCVRIHTTTGILFGLHPTMEGAVEHLTKWERSPEGNRRTALGGAIYDDQGNVLVSWGEEVPDVSPYRSLSASANYSPRQCPKCTAWTIDGGHYDPGSPMLPSPFGICLDCTELDTTNTIRRIVPPGEPLPARTSKKRKQYRRKANQ